MANSFEEFLDTQITTTPKGSKTIAANSDLAPFDIKVDKTKVRDFNEDEFQSWYKEKAKKLNLDTDPDNPVHFYDYRAAYVAGAEPNQEGHWPSTFKKPGHPRMVIDGVNTQTGKKVKSDSFESFLDSELSKEKPSTVNKPIVKKSGILDTTLQGFENISEAEGAAAVHGGEVLKTLITGVPAFIAGTGSMLVPSTVADKKDYTRGDTESTRRLLKGVAPGIVPIEKATSPLEVVTGIRKELDKRYTRAKSAMELFTAEPKTEEARVAVEGIGKIVGFIPEKANEAAEYYSKLGDEAEKSGNRGKAEFWRSLATATNLGGEVLNLYALGKVGKLSDIPNTNWYRRLTIKERRLVDANISKMNDLIIKDKLTGAQVRDIMRNGSDIQKQQLFDRYVLGKKGENPFVKEGKPAKEDTLAKAERDRSVQWQKALPGDEVYLNPGETTGKWYQATEAGIVPTEAHPVRQAVREALNEVLLSLPSPSNLGEGFVTKEIPSTAVIKRSSYSVPPPTTNLEVEYRPVMQKNGKPFASRDRAEAVALDRGLEPTEFDVVPVEGGFAFQKKGVKPREVQPQPVPSSETSTIKVNGEEYPVEDLSTAMSEALGFSEMVEAPNKPIVQERSNIDLVPDNAPNTDTVGTGVQYGEGFYDAKFSDMRIGKTPKAKNIVSAEENKFGLTEVLSKEKGLDVINLLDEQGNNVGGISKRVYPNGEIKIGEIYLEPEYRGKGIAQYLYGKFPEAGPGAARTEAAIKARSKYESGKILAEVKEAGEIGIKSSHSVTADLSQKSKAVTKTILKRNLTNGSITEGTPIRMTTVDELRSILKDNKLPVGIDAEGHNVILAQPLKKDTQIVGYGANDKISAAIIFKPEHVEGVGGQFNEVIINPDTDINSIRFAVAGQPRLLNMQELRNLVSPKKKEVLSNDDIAKSFGLTSKGQFNVPGKESVLVYTDPVTGATFGFRESADLAKEIPMRQDEFDIKFAQSVINEPSKAKPYIERIGKRVFDSGKTDWFSWKDEVKQKLGDAYKPLSLIVKQVWDGIKKLAKSEKGSVEVGSTIGEFIKQRVIKRSEKHKLEKQANAISKISDDIAANINKLESSNGRQAYEKFIANQVTKLEKEITRLEKIGSKTKASTIRKAVKALKERSFEAHLNNLKRVKERLDKVVSTNTERAAATLDKTDVLSPKIKVEDVKFLHSMPDIKFKHLERFIENPIYTFEEWGRSVKNGENKIKELLVYPIREAKKKAVEQFKVIHEKSQQLEKDLPRGASRRIYEYALSQERGGAEILDAMGIKEVPVLTKEEMAAYEWMRKGYEVFFEKVNAGRLKAGLKPFGKVENYFTLARDMSMAERLGFGFDYPLLNKDIHAKGTKFVYALERKGGLKKVQLDAFNVFNQYIQSATMHMYLSPETAKIREYLHKQVVAPNKVVDFEDTHPNAYKVITDYVDFVTGQKHNMLPSGLEAVLNLINNNLTTATLSGNIRSAGIQPTALLNTYAAIGPKYTALGAKCVFEKVPGKDITWQDFAKQESDHLVNREFDVNITPVMSGALGKASKIREKWNKSWIGMKALKELDKQTATITWIGAYRKGVEVDKLEFGSDEARRYADDTVIKTQGSAAKEDLAPIQRSNLGKFFTTFQTFVINNWNFIKKEVAGISNIKMSKLDSAHKVARWLFGVTLINSLFEDVLKINSPLPAPISAGYTAYEKTGEISDTAVAAALESLQLVPGLGNLRYGSTLFGAAPQYLSDISQKIAAESGGTARSNKFWLELGGKALGIPGTVQAVKMYNILDKGGSIGDALVGAHPETKKQKQRTFNLLYRKAIENNDFEMARKIQNRVTEWNREKLRERKPEETIELNYNQDQKVKN